MMDKETLRRVVRLQREELLLFERGVEREDTDKIELDAPFAIVLSGIRRCGKSTMLRQLMKKVKGFYYFNFEDSRATGFDIKDFENLDKIFHEEYKDQVYYFFDEIQNIPQWEIFVRRLVDLKEKIIITGSNASLLSKELGTKLTVRHLQIELFPFSFNEFLSIKKEKPSIKSFEEYLYKGGFPEYIKKENPSILHELLLDVVMKDIAARFGIKNTSILNKIAIFLISNVGKEFSYNSIKRAFDVKSVQSVIDYISYFENAYLIFTISRFSYSYKQQQVNPKKVYSIDNGFSYNNSASFSKDNGKMLENIVFLGLRR